MFINMEEVAEDAYKNTELLLSQYTKVMFRIEKNLVEMCIRDRHSSAEGRIATAQHLIDIFHLSLSGMKSISVSYTHLLTYTSKLSVQMKENNCKNSRSCSSSSENVSAEEAYTKFQYQQELLHNWDNQYRYFPISSLFLPNISSNPLDIAYTS